MKNNTTSKKGKFSLHKWLLYPKFNYFIEGVNIIPFKCPLDKEYDAYMREEQQFRFQDVYELSVGANKPITDVIDLVHIPRYDPNQNDFFPRGVQYHSFRLPSKTIPSKETFERIMNFMDDLLKSNRVIGIHCKHGLNRTGFIVCSYLVIKLGWNPSTAIQSFNRARGHPIIHEVYIKAILDLKPKTIKNANQAIGDNTDLEQKIEKEEDFGKPKGFVKKWLSFSKFNRFISDVNIIPFKCPLNETYDSLFSENDQFKFQLVYDFSIQENKRITDVIDLTNKSRYNPQTKDFFPPDVQYYNFRFPGKAIPDKTTFETIMNLMEDLIKKGRVIGIHCKNGVNKTGLIICSFLVTRLGWDPNVALKSFVMARSHEITNEAYIKTILSLQPKNDKEQTKEFIGKNKDLELNKKSLGKIGENETNGFIEKWIRYKKFNQFIEGVDIIPFKCPLNTKYDSFLNKEDLFRFKELYDFSFEVKKPITDVIDLTNKPKYNPNNNNFFPITVKHYRFKIPKKEIPEKALLEAIMNLMEDLIVKKKVIGIHCKQGINKTGFIVCAFLVTRLRWKPEIAIQSFNAARGHEITYEPYLKAILSFTN